MLENCIWDFMVFISSTAGAAVVVSMLNSTDGNILRGMTSTFLVAGNYLVCKSCLWSLPKIRSSRYRLLNDSIVVFFQQETFPHEMPCCFLDGVHELIV